MRPYNPAEPLIYLHIPKCAGSSIVFLLARWFYEGYHKLNQDESKDVLLPRIATQDEQGNWLPKVQCIHAHFNHGRGYGLPYYFPEVKQYLTMMRDPFDVAVSMYFFAKRKSQEGKYWFRGKQVDIRERFSTVGDYVSHYPYWFFDHLPIDIDLSNYREKLQERFVYIGVFEDMDRSIKCMAKILGKKPVELPRLNVSVYDEPIPESFRKQFYEDYPLLKRIYDFAVERYQAV
jgi:hypothetical protein